MSSIAIDLSAENEVITKIRERMQERMAKFLSDAADAVAKVIRKKVTKLAKADDDDDQIKYLAAAAYEAISWDSIVDDVEDDLYEAADEGSTVGFAQLEVSDSEMIAAVNEIAADFAHDRAAELV